jgi:sRNA-binding carbon storage regulator CsrA
VGITAPPQVTVHRGEVHQRLQEFHDCPGSAEQNKIAAASE